MRYYSTIEHREVLLDSFGLADVPAKELKQIGIVPIIRRYPEFDVLTMAPKFSKFVVEDMRCFEEFTAVLKSAEELCSSFFVEKNKKIAIFKEFFAAIDLRRVRAISNITEQKELGLSADFADVDILGQYNLIVEENREIFSTLSKVYVHSSLSSEEILAIFNSLRSINTWWPAAMGDM